MTKICKVVLFVALVVVELSSKFLGIVEYVVNNIANLFKVPLEEHLELIPIEKSQLFANDFPNEFDTFLILIKLPNKVNLLMYFLLQKC